MNAEREGTKNYRIKGKLPARSLGGILTCADYIEII